VLLTKSLALECAAHNVHVNAVCPGVIRAPMAEGWIKQGAGWFGEAPEETWARFAEAHPLGRVGEADEVGRTVLFLVSDEASFITGAALSVDGGMAVGSPPSRPDQRHCFSWRVRLHEFCRRCD
jgi:NAD(P)-dependent dehydrogenase (short-subunit alcohol dehydrogenase family)